MSTEIYAALRQPSPTALPLLKSLLENGAQVNEPNPSSVINSPLHEAARTHNPEIISLLIAHGANVTQKDAWEMTPLLPAVSHGKLENCKLLLAHGADPYERSREGDTLLKIAVLNEHPEIVELLLDAGVDTEGIDLNGSTALDNAVRIDNRDRTIIGGVEMEKVVDSFSTKKLEIMRLLIARGCDLDARTVDGATALHDAALIGDPDCVRILLEAGADANAMDDCWRTPLWPAVRQGNVEVVRMLLERTRDVDFQVYNGHTCLSTAARWGLLECVELLLAKGAEIWSLEPGPGFLDKGERVRFYGADALFWAADTADEDENCGEIVKRILEAGRERYGKERFFGESYADMVGVWERGGEEKLKRFREWIGRRLGMAKSPELDRVRGDVRDGVYKLEEEKRRRVRREIGLVGKVRTVEGVGDWDLDSDDEDVDVGEGGGEGEDVRNRWE